MSNEQRYWFTSDLHLSHKKVIEYCNRPFASVEEMNEAIINNINSVVHPRDILFMIGDITFERNQHDAINQLKRIKCHKHLLRGNHDDHIQDSVFKRAGFESISDLRVVKVRSGEDVQHITLCHYAMKVWPASHYGTWHLYGHSHGNMPDDPNSLSLDVGVDCWNYFPVSYEQIKERMALKTWVPKYRNAPQELPVSHVLEVNIQQDT